jgi:hypothetical protein
MKPPRTEAELTALLDAEEAVLAATKTDAEYWAVFREQRKVPGPLDEGPWRDAFEVLDEIGAELDAKHPDSGGAEGAS